MNIPTKPTVWELKSKAKKVYPHSLYMQKQWIRTSAHLYQTDKHGLLTGGWNRV